MNEIPQIPSSNFWLRLWQSVIVTIALLMVCITAHSINLVNTQESLVRSGNDPIAVRCMTSSSDAICVAYVAGRK